MTILATSAVCGDDTDVSNLSVMTEAVHAHGGLAGVELWYGAAHSGSYESRMPVRGVSQLNSEDFYDQSCYEMSVEEIHELQGFYVDAARRAVRAGFDVINVYAGHFHTIALQFLGPFYNKRTDQYGGSFENRARFLKETLEKVREEVGDEAAVGTRFNIDSLRGSDGIEVDQDGLRLIEHLDHLVDFWDLHIGSITNWEDDTGPSRMRQENWCAPWIGRARSASSKPIIAVGRYVSPDVMVDVIRSGTADIIGAARPSIADPFLPKKIEEGRIEDIRECIGCNICIAVVWGVGSRLVCTQNPPSARSTAGDGTPRSTPEPPTTIRPSWWWAPGWPDSNAGWCSARGEWPGCTSPRLVRSPAEPWHGYRTFRDWASGAAPWAGASRRSSGSTTSS